MNEPDIEPAALDDLHSLIALVRSCVARMREQGIEQWDEVYPAESDVRRDIEAGTQWVLRDGGSLAGCLTLDENQDPMWAELNWRHVTGRITCIHRVMVSPAHQRRGFARKLMVFAEDLARQRGFASVRLDAFTQNPGSLALYEGLGYTRAGIATMRKGTFIGFEKALQPVD